MQWPVVVVGLRGRLRWWAVPSETDSKISLGVNITAVADIWQPNLDFQNKLRQNAWLEHLGVTNETRVPEEIITHLPTLSA